MNVNNERDTILNIEASLHKAIYGENNEIDAFYEALTNVPENITGMRALLSFCESYDYEPAYEYLLDGGVFEKLALEYEYYRLYNIIVRAADMFYDYANYELELTKAINEQENKDYIDDIKVVLNDFVSKSLTEDELEKVNIKILTSIFVPEKKAIKIRGSIENKNAFDLGIMFMHNVEDYDRESLHTGVFRFRIDGKEKNDFILYIPATKYDMYEIQHIVLIPYLY